MYVTDHFDSCAAKDKKVEACTTSTCSINSFFKVVKPKEKKDVQDPHDEPDPSGSEFQMYDDATSAIMDESETK